MRYTTFSLRLDPTSAQEGLLRRHVGAARFAYNTGLQLVKQALQARQSDLAVKVPWSGFDLINAFNRWKVSPAAGAGPDGKPGLAWRNEVLAQVFEEGVIDLGRGLQAFSRGRREKKTRTTGFPSFRKRGQRDTFRVRNASGGVRIDVDSLRLPKIGLVNLAESSRRLRRILRVAKNGSPRGRILFVTVSHKAGRWYARFNVEAVDFHEAIFKSMPRQRAVVGIDRGLHCYAVAATANGTEQWRSVAPKPLYAHLQRLRRQSRSCSRKQKGSRRRAKSAQRLGRLHHRIANVRLAHVHALSTHVAKTHSHVSLEDLHTAGMMRNRHLSRAIADSCWGMLARQLDYKGSWYGCRVTYVDRFAPTSKTCCKCHHKVATLSLAQRWFICPSCGWQADRDTNAAANCARLAEADLTLAGKQPERLNDRREAGSGYALRSETGLNEAVRTG